MKCQSDLDHFIREALDAVRSMPPPKPPKPEKPKEQIHVLIDTREQTPWKFSKWATVETVTLSEGDYSLAGFTDKLRIERKSLPDLIGSITTRREQFMAECERLVAYPFRLLVIEGTKQQVECEQYRSRISPASIFGTVSSLYARYGIASEWWDTHSEAGRRVEWLLRRYQQIWRPKS